MADKTPTPLEALQKYLGNLFQFDSADLDFGIYKILHIKEKELKKFVDELLTTEVKKQLKLLSTSDTKALQKKLEELESQDTITKYNEAVEKKNTERIKIYEEDFSAAINEYKQVKSAVANLNKSNASESDIYNHLTRFFSRYYDKGDFVSKRRYGKNEKYVVPYNGEETYFHWANNDQYYIKSTEFFRRYAFRINHSAGTLLATFRIAEAEEENGNGKSDENKYFVLAKKKPELNDKEFTIWLDYRTISEKEKETIGKKQEEINNKATAQLKEQFGKNPILADLFKSTDSGKNLLEKKFSHYTARNKYDFFIHKDLKNFLERELDFYIKNEFLNLDEMGLSESETHYEQLHIKIKAMKTFRHIANTIIEFLSSIENFQKQLWEKKKFVISTNYVITLDKLEQLTSIAFVETLIPELLKSKEQLKEWEMFFGHKLKTKNDFHVPTNGKQLKMETEKFASKFLKLPVDTKYFSEQFKQNILNEISENKNVDEELSGLAFHSDNYHGLNLLHEKYYGGVTSIYIDPPYNTDASAILYKNDYKDSSWFSFMDSRLEVAAELLMEKGIICVAIDDVEVIGLRHILAKLFQKEIGIAAVRSNPAGRKTKGKFAPAHEYALFFGNSQNSLPSGLEITEKRLDRYPKKDDKGNFAWANFIRSGSNDKREDRPKLYYPIFVHKNDTIRIPEMEWDDAKNEYTLLEKPTKDEEIVFPIMKNNGNGAIEKNWQRGCQRVPNELDEYRVRRNDKGEISIDFKTRMDEDSLPITWWDSKKYASANYGAAELKELFGKKTFDFPKAKTLVQDCLIASGGAEEKTSVILDFFPGSGTTFQATQILNKVDDGNRKCILVEEGTHLNSIIIPRIKKVAYSLDWKDGKAQNQNGLGVFFKYQKLEQYEDALENIVFDREVNTAQTQLQFADYIPKYMMQFETKGSNTFVNTDEMQNPFTYQLKVFDNYQYIPTEVDLVETFNYLIGLHIHKHITAEHQKRQYVFVTGNDRHRKGIAVVWRNTKDLDLNKDKDFITKQLDEIKFSTLFVNGDCMIANYNPIEPVFKNKMLK